MAEFMEARDRAALTAIKLADLNFAGLVSDDVAWGMGWRHLIGTVIAAFVIPDHITSAFFR
jgi:hypothetical protein